MTSGAQLERVNARIDKNIKKHVSSTRKLLMQPSSSQEDIGIEDCAELVAKMYESAGCEGVRVEETRGSPIVYGECKGESEKTLLVYFMYDTMPYNEPGWRSPPMAAKVVDMTLPSGKVKAIVNRGADNTKGPLAAFLNAVGEATRSAGRPPVGLVFVAEGEEELGSPDLPAFVRKEKKRLSRADACYFPYFAQDADGVPNTFLGVKGVVYFELECSGKRWGRGPQESAIHSANKAWADSPVWRLIDALGTLTSNDGERVLVDGFYDDVADPSKEDEEVIAETAERFDPKVRRRELSLKRFSLPDEDRAGLIRKYTYTSTLNIDGIWSGWMEKGSKTILPHEARCKIDIRTVPNQKTSRMMPLVRKHLDKHGYSDIRMTEVDTGYDWCRASVNEPVVQSMVRSLTAFGHPPMIWPTSGGSVPFYVFSRILRMPFTMGGMGHSGLAHSPNEYMVLEGNKRVAGLAEVEKFHVHFMSEFGQSP